MIEYFFKTNISRKKTWYLKSSRKTKALKDVLCHFKLLTLRCPLIPTQFLEQIEQSSNERQKYSIGFALLCSVIGSENLHHSLNQSNAKITLTMTYFPALSALCLFLFWVLVDTSGHFLFFKLNVVITLIWFFQHSIEKACGRKTSLPCDGEGQWKLLRDSGIRKWKYTYRFSFEEILVQISTIKKLLQVFYISSRDRMEYWVNHALQRGRKMCHNHEKNTVTANSPDILESNRLSLRF